MPHAPPSRQGSVATLPRARALAATPAMRLSATITKQSVREADKERTMDTMMSMPVSITDRIAPIARQVWDAKYRLKAQDGTTVDVTIEDTWRRVARALAAVEDHPLVWEPRFTQALEDFRFLPAGRILAGAGTDRRVSRCSTASSWAISATTSAASSSICGKRR